MSYNIILGFESNEFEKLCPYLDVEKMNILKEKKEEASDLTNLYDFFEDSFSGINHKLISLSPTFLSDFGFNITQASEERITANTPIGVRQFNPISLHFFFDPYGVDRSFDNSVIGFSLTSSFMPTFLDWKDENGKSQNFLLDDDALEAMSFIKEKLSIHFPVFSSAKFIFRSSSSSFL